MSPEKSDKSEIHRSKAFRKGLLKFSGGLLLSSYKNKAKISMIPASILGLGGALLMLQGISGMWENG